jgi:hypothetical protein
VTAITNIGWDGDGKAPTPPPILTAKEFTDYATLAPKLELIDKWIIHPHKSGYKDGKEAWVGNDTYSNRVQPLIFELDHRRTVFQDWECNW